MFFEENGVKMETIILISFAIASLAVVIAFIAQAELQDKARNKRESDTFKSAVVHDKARASEIIKTLTCLDDLEFKSVSFSVYCIIYRHFN